MLDGPRIIEGESTRICGLAVCISCQQNSNMTEEEYRNSCPYHCEDPTLTYHPLLEAPPEDVDEDNEAATRYLVEPIITFVPDYERILYAFDAIKKMYKVEGSIDTFTGNRLVYLRGRQMISDSRRRPKYIKNETHVMFKSLKRCFEKATKRCKVRKIASKKSTTEDENSLSENEDDFLILSQESNMHTSNDDEDEINDQNEFILPNDDDLILSQESEFLSSPSSLTPSPITHSSSMPSSRSSASFTDTYSPSSRNNESSSSSNQTSPTLLPASSPASLSPASPAPVRAARSR